MPNFSPYQGYHFFVCLSISILDKVGNLVTTLHISWLFTTNKDFSRTGLFLFFSLATSHLLILKITESKKITESNHGLKLLSLFRCVTLIAGGLVETDESDSGGSISLERLKAGSKDRLVPYNAILWPIDQFRGNLFIIWVALKRADSRA